MDPEAIEDMVGPHPKQHDEKVEIILTKDG